VYLRIADVMGPAVTRGAMLATAVSVPIALLGIGAVLFAVRRARQTHPSA
jgi:uncharacterized membrane-anchored protein